ncbi:hypothetical protein ACXR2U_15030 [Jatrophihabitans sp. YIM 134969]
MRRGVVVVVAIVALCTGLLAAVAAPVSADAAPAPLTNLAHLDFLTTTVTPPRQAGHTTYRLADEPGVGVLWVYADRNDDGSFRRVGGGALDPATGDYEQGAYDTDDIARAAVVYLRHWRQFGDAHSRQQAYQQLRGLTYLQTTTGPHAGNVVLWMQPDGTLNPSAFPVELPDPSDSANSYWLARTVWALGEGYAAFAGVDRGFANFLAQRLRLALTALQRETLARYGQTQVVDGDNRPAWLIAGGADATAEAVLGLAAYVGAGRDDGARAALRQFAEGIAAQGSGSSSASWPYGAILPSASSNSLWHAWGGLAPAALATASGVLGDRSLLAPAVADTAGFTPDLLASYGPVNGLTPVATDRTVIAYGVDSRVQSLLAAARAARSTGLRDLAGVAAGWYFGQNAAGVPVYDPATGVTADGVSVDGVVNRNSGAESTIHGLLSMLALDADPAAARLARAASGAPTHVGTTTVEGESATVNGAAGVVAVDPPYSAESAWSGGEALQFRGVATATWEVAPSSSPRVLEAVVERVPRSSSVLTFGAGRTTLGRVGFGGAGARGVSAVPGELQPVVLGIVPAGATSVTATSTAGTGRLDALLLTPLVSALRTGPVGLLASRSDRGRSVRVGAVTATAYDRDGRAVRTSSGPVVTVPAGGFAITRTR